MVQSESQSTPSPSALNTFVPNRTADGSYTFFSSTFNEAFHSRHGARLEAERKFVEPTQLAQIASQSTVCLLDVCYGLGYNTAAALDTIWRINPHCHIHWYGLELNVDVPRSAIAHHLLDQWPPPIPHHLAQLTTPPYSLFLAHSPAPSFSSPAASPVHLFTAHLLLGDARQTIQQVVQSSFQADAIFLDPFSTATCPQLWTVDFLAQVTQCLAPNGRLATYSCAAAIRTALRIAGLQVGSTPGVGRKSPGTIANFTGTNIPSLSQEEQEHLQTRAAIPYRDPSLADSMADIVQRRRQEQAISTFESTSQWKKRWRSKI
ncbi:MAG: hypothetical protein F6K09_01675 [Merismopedia sp. SIO2A8]|nr:hypothetical protein [Symploca sp. SIO2B6]NET47437.1 hypothetical protein [Merismopedia sp. SIO2A8]